MTVDTIAQERAAILALVENAPGIKSSYDHEPKQIGQTPAVTVFFAGIEAAEHGNLRTAKQLRNYEVRVYVTLEDMRLAQDLCGQVAIDIWDRLITTRRLGDTLNVIIAHVGDTTISFVTGEEGKPYIQSKIGLTIEHRSPYNG